jgi:hypothetical protein
MHEQSKDGVDHINIYSRGETKLGRGLSHMASIGFDLPEDGHFNTLEGYWYWLSTGRRHEEFRALGGFECKKMGRQMPRITLADFQSRIKIANRAKIMGCPELLRDVIESYLPFEHYYTYGDKRIEPTSDEWLKEMFETLRSELP